MQHPLVWIGTSQGYSISTPADLEDVGRAICNLNFFFFLFFSFKTTDARKDLAEHADRYLSRWFQIVVVGWW